MTTANVKIMRAISAVFLAAIISAATAVLPMVASVGKVVYANIVSVILAGMELGPVGGAAYAVLAGFVLNSVGMGSGVLPYVLIFQIIEAALIGIVWHGKKLTAMRFFAFIFGAAFFLKPVSYLLFYIFNQQIIGDTGCFQYVDECYAGFMRHGWGDTLAIYASGILCGCLLRRLLGYIFDKIGKGEITA